METKKKVISIVADVLEIKDASEIKPENKLVDDLAADSIDIVDIVMHIESELYIWIPDDDADLYLNKEGCCVQDLINLTNHTLNK